MIYKTPSSRPGHVRVVFELPACIWADRIFLVGEFNHWRYEATPFVQGRDGVWRAAVDLVAGRTYQFRYLVDGSWQTDYHADGWVANEFGSQNSIVEASLADREIVGVEPAELLHEGFRESGRRRQGAGLSPLTQSRRAERYPKVVRTAV